MAAMRSSPLSEPTLQDPPNSPTPTPSKGIRLGSPSSINDILRTHQRERLYIRPLHWTSRHLDLLDCVFVPPAKTGKQSDDEDARVPDVPRWYFNTAMGKALTLFGLFYDHGIRKPRNPHLHFTFAQRPVCHLAVQDLYAASPTSPAVVAYLDLKILARRRDDSIPLVPFKNAPVVQLHRKRRARIRPERECRDPYIAVVLIALAQGQRHQNNQPMVGSSPPGTPESGSLASPKVYLFAGTDNAMYLYTAEIPVSFLDRLDRPSERYAVEQVQLKYRKIPFKKLSRLETAVRNIVQSVSIK